LLQIQDRTLAELKLKYVGKGELGGITHEHVWKHVLQELHMSDQFDAVLAMWWSAEHWILDTKLLIQELYRAEYSLAIFTTNWAGMGETTLKKLALSSCVAHRFESSKEGLKKPDIAFYKLVEQRLHAHGQEIYFIDDTKMNIEVAKERQWRTFHFDLGNDRGKTSNSMIRRELLATGIM